MEDLPSILIVDDIALNIQILANCLKDDYRLKIATGGEQCLKIAQEEPYPDLILLDIEMPDIDGYEVCRRLKNNHNTVDIPIIFVTAKQDLEDEEYGLTLGAVDYITKPIHPAVVRARIKTHITLKKQNDKLRAMALFDQLTGLYNRHYLLDICQKKIARAIRYRQPLALLMIDIDHFKHVNDEYGHPAGDTILQEVSQSLLAASRKEDVVARWGGEEMVVFLDNCELDNAVKKAENLRVNIENLLPLDIKITISIGVGLLQEGEHDISEMLKRADLALYQAKDNGRNQVVSQ